MVYALVAFFLTRVTRPRFWRWVSVLKYVGLEMVSPVLARSSAASLLYNLPEEMCEPGEPGCAKIWEVWCTKSIPPEAIEVVGRPKKPEREACRSA